MIPEMYYHLDFLKAPYMLQMEIALFLTEEEIIFYSNLEGALNNIFEK